LHWDEHVISLVILVDESTVEICGGPWFRTGVFADTQAHDRATAAKPAMDHHLCSSYRSGLGQLLCSLIKQKNHQQLVVWSLDISLAEALQQ